MQSHVAPHRASHLSIAEAKQHSPHFDSHLHSLLGTLGLHVDPQCNTASYHSQVRELHPPPVQLCGTFFLTTIWRKIRVLHIQPLSALHVAVCLWTRYTVFYGGEDAALCPSDGKWFHYRRSASDSQRCPEGNSVYEHTARFLIIHTMMRTPGLDHHNLPLGKPTGS